MIYFQGLEKAMREVLVHTLSIDELNQIYELVDITSETAVDYALFAGLASLAERVLYPKFL